MKEIETFDDQVDFSDSKFEKEYKPEDLFESMVIVYLVENYKKEMSEIGFSDNQIISFLLEIDNLKEKDQKMILSLPFEIRKNNLKIYKEELKRGNMTVNDMVSEMLETAKEFGFDIGFHTSPFEIKKEKDKRGNVTWNVHGSENDHRDNDLKMAYYSKRYENIYSFRDFNYIYIIRSSDEHRNDGKWYRAPELPIIGELKISRGELLDKLEEEKKRIKNNREL